MDKGHSAVLACAGAVIGAGFASGRETVTFFVQYGWHGWWLIVLAVILMTAICALCMHEAGRCGCDWTQLLPKTPLASACPLVLMMLTAGAMLSAAGHMIALVWHHPHAYILGVAGTLWAAWRMGSKQLKILHAASSALTLGLLCALMAAFQTPLQQIVALERQFSFTSLAVAAVRAIGYAAMNMMLAIGVVCRSAYKTQNVAVTAGLFGWVIGMLLFISQWVYSRNPQAAGTAFPLITLLRAYGRNGYLAGVILLYLSIATSLASVFCALQTALETRIQRRDIRWLIIGGIPLAVSGIGFEGIVDRLYAPAGLLCLIAVFLPMAFGRFRTISP